jgi:uncharacterized heparinase superfamily protein
VERLPIGQSIERYYHTLRIYPRRLLRARAAAALKRRTVHPLQAVFLLPPARRAHLRRQPPLLPGAPGLVERVNLGQRVDQAWTRTKQLARGRFALLGREVVFTDHVDWGFSGVPAEWRRALQCGDYLVDVGLAGLEDPAPDAVPYTVFRGIVRDWMASNRPGRGDGWRPYALSRRVANWIYASRLLGPALTADEPFGVRLRASLFRQVHFLERNVERDRADNHLIANGRALMLAGWYFDGEHAPRWRGLGREILWNELRNQVREDGGHYERSPHRHAVVLGDYLEALAVLHAAGEEVPPWVEKRVRAMAGFLQRLLLPDGKLPGMHDGVAVEVAPPSDLLAVAAALFREPSLRPSAAPTLDVWPYILLGEEGARRYAGLANIKEPRTSRALRRTGYYVLAGPEGDEMVVDAQGITAPHLGAHAHCNVFGYELAVGGKRVIVDSGATGYEPGMWRDYFRSTRAHNTVSVDGAEQSELWGSGGVAAYAEVGPVRWLVREGLVYFEATHDGFARLAPGLLHTRRIFFLPGRFWCVCDEIRGTGAHDVESYVHFHPDVRIDVACNERTAFQAKWPGGTMRIVPFETQSVELTAGTLDGVPRGWYSPGLGKADPASLLVLRGQGELPLTLGYLLLPRQRQQAHVRCERDAFLLRVDVVINDWEYRMTCVQDEVELTARQWRRDQRPPFRLESPPA